MVVKFIKSDDLLTLQDKVNEFIVEKDKELRNDTRVESFKFQIDLKIAPYKEGSWGQENHGVYFIAVIQY